MIVRLIIVNCIISSAFFLQNLESGFKPSLVALKKTYSNFIRFFFFMVYLAII